ncbi:MAG: 3D domain-containing protein [Candidatus Eremiobacteraeota bacterium]|nr:3D domain-containing protein [Candidatus Eremiobacteraeota bacterium]
MSVNDRNSCPLKAAYLAATALALTLTFGTPALAGAVTPPLPLYPQAAAPAPNVTTVPQAADATATADTVLLTSDGIQTSYTTRAETVAAFMSERGLRVGPDDFVSPEAGAPIEDGMRVEYRAAVPLVLFVGKHKHRLRSSAATIGELLGVRHIRLDADDEVSPMLATPLIAGQIVQVTHRRTWTAEIRTRIAPKIKERIDANMPLGATRTLAKGCAGYRETTVRVVNVDDGVTTRTVLASRIIRPHPRIIVRGLAAYSSLAHVAAAGFASVLHFAGSALHVIATAYTAQCYGCSGTTASGARAGFGIIAVDPSVIPLGTHLFVPGYGRAVAGDTGGAIHGNRVDLGFDTLADAMRFGRRPVTVYVLK